MSYKLYGTPIPLQRPRFSKGHVWDCQKTEKLRDGLLIKVQHGNQPIYDHALHLNVEFIFPIPGSYSAKKKAELHNTPHHRKPDIDNLLKYLLDVCNTILYTDDCLITNVVAHKKYGPIAMTLFTLTPML